MRRINWAHAIVGTIWGSAVIVISSCGDSNPGAGNDNSSNSNPVVIFDNGNVGGVLNNPTSPTTFTIQRYYRITLIRDYHWNDGAGTTSPGTIALSDGFGTTYGPWQTTETDAMNYNWECTPNEIIPPGTYTVLDSDPATWSHNPTSGNAGMSYIEGIPIGDGTDGENNSNENSNTNVNENENDNGNNNSGGVLEELQQIHRVQVILEGAELLWQDYSCEGEPSTIYATVNESEYDNMWDLYLNDGFVWSGYDFSGEDEYYQVSGRFSEDGSTLLELTFIFKKVDNTEGWMVSPPFDEERRNITVLNLPLQESVYNSDSLVGYAGVDHPENGSASSRVDLDVALVYGSCAAGGGGHIDYWPRWTVLPLDIKWDNANLSVYLGQ